jgi:hypothetical protein
VLSFASRLSVLGSKDSLPAVSYWGKNALHAGLDLSLTSSSTFEAPITTCFMMMVSMW